MTIGLCPTGLTAVGRLAALDLTRPTLNAMWFITWDPTQPVATRPLAIQKDGTWYTYGWDLTKSICEVYGYNGYIRTTYSYTPYGAVTANGYADQPLQWSSEYNDTELGLVYYNYRHYNPAVGRWMVRDNVGEIGGYNNYGYVANGVIAIRDNLGQHYTVNVDEETCTIIFKLVIVLVFDSTIPKNDKQLIQKQIESTIESEWSGQKKGCCTVNVDVEIREPSIWNHVEDFFTPKNRENNYVSVTYNQTGGYKGTNRSYVEASQKGVFVANPAEVNGAHNPRTDYATWSYAHEAGHLMRLEDGYYEENNETKVKPGYNGDEMMTSAFFRVSPSDVERLIAQTDCSCKG